MCLGIAALAFLCVPAMDADASDRYITVASTTSTQNSGLFDHILPRFKAASGISVRVVAVGTGAAIRLARNGDADVLLVHHRPSEETFVREGFGVARHDLMYNDFVVVGPASDPAGVAAARTAGAAFRRVAAVKAPFVSRGDDSGTHKRERMIWAGEGFDPTTYSGTWYRETGSGMGATLNTAAAMAAYTLTDRGTWLSFRNRHGMKLLFEGDPGLRNQYGVILVSSKRHSHVKSALGQRFIDWLLSAQGRAAIAGHRIGGEQLFYVN
jgi:tungstate transport system substrate-binding protein